MTINDKKKISDESKLWQEFSNKFNLSDTQLNKFQKYANLIVKWNKSFNITSIEEISEIIPYHFEDSLSVGSYIDFDNINFISDIGTGAGFPAIPIKIKYPHLKVVLIEVNAKKRSFLENVINELSLEDMELYPFDWRTFLRKSEFSIDIFVSRAALQTDELTRMFKPNCIYNKAELIYWASINWLPQNKDLPYFKKEEVYEVGNKKRKLIFFKKEK